MIKEFVKKHPVISAGIVGGLLYTVGKSVGMSRNESFHADEINQNGCTTFYDLKNDKDITTILKPVVEATVENTEN